MRIFVKKGNAEAEKISIIMCKSHLVASFRRIHSKS